MAKVKLTELYKSLNEQSFFDDEDDLLGDFDAQLKKDMAKAGYGKRDSNKIFKRGDDAKFAKDDDKAPEQKKTNNKYDPGNEPLEIQLHTGDFMYLDPDNIEAYVNGEDVYAIDPDRGGDEKLVNKDNSDVTPDGEERIKDFKVIDDDDRFSGNEDAYGADLEEREYKRKKSPSSKKKRMPADGTPPPQNEQGCTEQEIAEGTCGYGVDGDLGNKPAGSHLMDYVVNERTGKFVRSKNKIKKKANKSVIKRLQKLANIKKSEN